MIFFFASLRVYHTPALKRMHKIQTNGILISESRIPRLSINMPAATSGNITSIKKPYIVTYLVKFTDHTDTFASIKAYTAINRGSPMLLYTAIPGIKVYAADAGHQAGF